MDEGSDCSLKRLMALSAEIIELCREHPELCSVSSTKIEEIVRTIGHNLKSPAVTEIARHTAERNENGHLIKAQTKHYRMIAAQLAKRHKLPFDAKRARKKATVMEWLDEHWNTVRRDFFVLFDKIEETLAEVD
jgi:hypothetical protein